MFENLITYELFSPYSCFVILSLIVLGVLKDGFIKLIVENVEHLLVDIHTFFRFSQQLDEYKKVCCIPGHARYLGLSLNSTAEVCSFHVIDDLLKGDFPTQSLKLDKGF